ncbi:ABC transporter ATP-binding protein [Rhodovarius lipocyclicus]|uniref:ABC transporter ATP-binding protein n=1 Tax=Rhodovarius lipocyclicus TaxID=268410 RepID=UPI0013586A59|nr:ABC transporter ATP-binding protein [Rhodovarius lipocyclicus]
MATEIAIEVNGLSKSYLMYAEPRDRLLQAVIPRLRRIGLPIGAKTYYNEHWALRELSFQVARGESVAVVGRNGSGKSTLLQLICGTLNPTSGSVVVRGRVAALLELGSGFNPEYTGRENIILNASVLGLTHDETLSRMEQILEFADIGEFVDQPVKTYSSGMAMRLAFAVIAHVDADVLIIDEALAVGDAMFQQKCFRWLRNFQSRGTVLFCGHDIGAVLNLCQRAIWLDRGHLRMLGSAREVAEAYTAYVSQESTEASSANAQPTAPTIVEVASSVAQDAPLLPVSNRDSFGSRIAQITHIRLTLEGGSAPAWLEGGEAIVLTFRIETQQTLENAIVGVMLKDRLGQLLVGTNSLDYNYESPLTLPLGVSLTHFHFTLPVLAPGEYAFACAIATGTQESHIMHHWLHEALVISVRRTRWNGSLVAAPLKAFEIEPESPPN